MTTVKLKVEPDSNEFKVENGFMPKIYLENRAENGRANAELRSRLEEILGERPGIVSGTKSRRKKLKLEMSEQKFNEKIEEVSKKWEK